MSTRPADLAVLVSGGLDSAILCAELLGRHERVQPIFVRFGLRWEREELAGLRAFLEQIDRPGLAPLVVLDEPMAGVYGPHWSVGGPGIPDDSSPDEAVHLPGRNLLLIAKAAVFCQIHRIGTIAVGSLASNPFRDSSPEFDRSLETTLALGLGMPLRLIRPYARLSKVEVLGRGAGLPLGLTISCLDPRSGIHCGACNKCAERRRGFAEAGLADPTDYRTPSTVDV
ncbi:7-cyano-7-deazaguanine synthase [Tundrisphaera sp. TA3]|uniref:7-cyano-7-deazaguanine synthase n=1 Tax=Tundrisphaera sp. TA3 TaxID=3435775 RepID=UPI003EBABADE